LDGGFVSWGDILNMPVWNVRWWRNSNTFFVTQLLDPMVTFIRRPPKKGLWILVFGDRYSNFFGELHQPLDILALYKEESIFTLKAFSANCLITLLGPGLFPEAGA
jgi:hypothetical protein